MHVIYNVIEIPVFWLLAALFSVALAGWIGGREYERRRVREVEESPDNAADGGWTIFDEPGETGVLVCTAGNPNWYAEVHEGARLRSVSDQGSEVACPNCGITWREVP